MIDLSRMLDGALHHVVWTKKGTTYKLYIDGVAVTNQPPDKSLTT